MSFYEILEVSETATFEEIKKSYRKLSLKYHPDRNQGQPEMVAKFQKIGEAYETLSDPHKKEEYDMSQKNPFSHMRTQGSGMDNIDEIFSNLFGVPFGNMGMGMPFGNMGMGMGMPFGHGGSNMSHGGPHGGPNIRIFRNGVAMNLASQLQKPAPIIQTINITMAQVLTGATIPVEIERWLIENDNKLFEKETLYVAIAKGVDDNEIILLRDKGNVITDTCRGDIKLFVKIDNNTDFERHGLDLLVHRQISLKDALCGFSFELKYVNEKVYTIHNTRGNIIPPEYKKIIPKMGLSRDEHVGNLVIFFHIQFPEKLEEDVILKLNEIL